MFTNLTKQSLLIVSGPCILVLILSLFGSLAGGCVPLYEQYAEMTPPADYQPVAEIDLSTHAYEDEVVGQITLEETAVVGIFFNLQNIDTPYFELYLQGADGDNFIILQSAAYRTNEFGGGSWEHTLAPGEYQLVLTAHQSLGSLSLYWGQNPMQVN